MAGKDTPIGVPLRQTLVNVFTAQIQNEPDGQRKAALAQKLAIAMGDLENQTGEEASALIV
jgi:hypothetical protein